jgi:selenocysteine lyase/cysteine desulfurase
MLRARRLQACHDRLEHDLPPGFRTDIDQLGQACRERDAFFVVDAAQSCGILNTDVAAPNIAALAVSSQKGLLGLYGMGFDLGNYNFLGCATADVAPD